MQPSSFRFYHTSSYIETTPTVSIRLSFGNSFRCAQRCCLVICLATRYLLFRMYFARVSTIDAIGRRSTSSKTMAIYHRQNNSQINGIPSCISIYLFSCVANWRHWHDVVKTFIIYGKSTSTLLPHHTTGSYPKRGYSHDKYDDINMFLLFIYARLYTHSSNMLLVRRWIPLDSSCLLYDIGYD